MTRFFYATGFKTYEAAEFALIDMFADGEVSLSEHPLVESYTTKNDKRRFAVTLNAE